VTHGEPRTAIVTGAGRGIGAAVARRLASHGHRVAVVDRDEAAAAETAAALGGLAITADVADEEAVTSTVAAVADALGPPTILVNNAGFARDQPIDDMPAADWDAVLGVHLRGAFLFSRAVTGPMRTAGWGRIVNISSISALGHENRVNYSAAKAGVNGFTQSLAVELGPAGVTVNAVAPGFIVSAMTARSAERLGRSFTEHQRLAAETLPVRRVGQPEDIAHAVEYLTSEGAGFVTGQILYVAGAPRG
jgi:3-oxoacyl-[acyl-carrier protein] reductase